MHICEFLRSTTNSRVGVKYLTHSLSSSMFSQPDCHCANLQTTAVLCIIMWSDKIDLMSWVLLTHLHKAWHPRHCWTVSRGSAKVRGAAGPLSAAFMGRLHTVRWKG